MTAIFHFRYIAIDIVSKHWMRFYTRTLLSKSMIGFLTVDLMLLVYLALLCGCDKLIIVLTVFALEGHRALIVMLNVWSAWIGR